jgi:hypothetical protein
MRCNFRNSLVAFFLFAGCASDPHVIFHIKSDGSSALDIAPCKPNEPVMSCATEDAPAGYQEVLQAGQMSSSAALFDLPFGHQFPVIFQQTTDPHFQCITIQLSVDKRPMDVHVNVGTQLMIECTTEAECSAMTACCCLTGSGCDMQTVQQPCK